MRCGNCGIEMVAGAAFCSSCGKPVGLAAECPAARDTALTVPGLQTNVVAALCYVAGLLTGFLFLVLAPYRHERFIRFHAWQSIFLSLASFLAYFVLGLLFISRMIAPLTWPLYVVLSLGLFALWLLLMYKAYNREQFKLPVIGDLAARQM